MPKCSCYDFHILWTKSGSTSDQLNHFTFLPSSLCLLYAIRTNTLRSQVVICQIFFSSLTSSFCIFPKEKNTSIFLIIFLNSQTLLSTNLIFIYYWLTFSWFFYFPVPWLLAEDSSQAYFYPYKSSFFSVVKTENCQQAGQPSNLSYFGSC